MNALPPADRAIDLAMASASESKNYIRSRWIQEINRRRVGHDSGVLYVTLCGAHGLDISALIDAGVIGLTENDSIAAADAGLVVAYEKNMPAVAAVKRKFPGLKVVESDIHEKLRVGALFASPSREDKQIFRAPVINLDYDGNVRIQDGKSPFVEAAVRLAEFHASDMKSWSLLITANASISWDEDGQKWAKSFLSQYLEEELVLSQKVQSDVRFLAEDCDLRQVDFDVQQYIVSIFLPLRLADDLVSRHWLVSPSSVFVYSGGGGAPMVSWILSIDHDPSAPANRLRLLKQLPQTLMACVEDLRESGGADGSDVAER
ncbi:hypothetical protein FFF93_003925 [Arthrobacter sp. KBS0702]|uniref:hypothetical protein n=1 Tax=Arthrobacter sp. KBS0702 TaxID=2578107 RepID=UPI00110D29CC|nr:hypothetical protein [Arthrobacter sp. KBS0702]QDW29019.1 hypothetical protein FFF93_003925 [Arthrobacter sp. KBS0702]